MELAKYAWVTDLRDGWGITLVSGATPKEIVSTFGGSFDEPVGDYTLADMNRLSRTAPGNSLRFFLKLFEHAGWLVAIENVGYSGMFPEVARRCSRNGHFFSVYWNVHAAGMVTEAVGGSIVAHYDSLYPLDPVDTEFERRPSWAIGPPVAPNLAWQVCMWQMEQRTGVVAESAWLQQRHPTYEVGDPYVVYRDMAGAELI